MRIGRHTEPDLAWPAELPRTAVPFQARATFVVIMPTALFMSPHLDDAVVFRRAAWPGCWRTGAGPPFWRRPSPDPSCRQPGSPWRASWTRGWRPKSTTWRCGGRKTRRPRRLLGFSQVRWLDLLEAPHRGNTTRRRPCSVTRTAMIPCVSHWPPISSPWRRSCSPDLVLAPQGLGNHVDHQQVIERRVGKLPGGPLGVLPRHALCDPPAGRRAPTGRSRTRRGASIAIEAVLDRKIAAAQCYTSQVGFQFGGAARTRPRPARLCPTRRAKGEAAERFLRLRCRNGNEGRPAVSGRFHFLSSRCYRPLTARNRSWPWARHIVRRSSCHHPPRFTPDRSR